MDINKLLNKNEMDATLIAFGEDLEVRVVERDQIKIPIDKAKKVNRVNFIIENSKIKKVWIG